MERKEALTKLRKLLGEKLGYRVDHKAASREERAAAKEDRPFVVAERDAAKEKMLTRQKELLDNDATYQMHRAAWRKAADECDKLASVLRHHKFTVGTASNLGGFGCFHVRAEGDSWEEVIAKLTAEKKAA